VAYGHEFRGAEFHEVETRERVDPEESKTQRCVRIGCRQLLSSLSFPGEYNSGGVFENAIGIGGTFMGGLAIVAPTALGGRAAVLAQTFEQVQIEWLRFIVVPAVPTSQGGSYYMAFTNDVGTPVDGSGASEHIHQSNRQYYVETSMFLASELEVDPSDTMLRYWDESAGDFRLEVQGYLKVGAATRALSVSGGSTFGDLIVEFGMKFSGETLDQDVPAQPTALVRADIGAAATTEEHYAVSFLLKATAPTTSELIMDSTTLPNGITVADLSDYYAFGTVGHSGYGPTTHGSIGQLTYNTATDSTVRVLARDQGVFFRFSKEEATGSTYAYMYTDLASASDSVPRTQKPDAVPDGLALWSATTSSTIIGSLLFNLTFVKLGDS
jgi:hypothetical protein